MENIVEDSVSERIKSLSENGYIATSQEIVYEYDKDDKNKPVSAIMTVKFRR